VKTQETHALPSEQHKAADASEGPMRPLLTIDDCRLTDSAVYCNALTRPERHVQVSTQTHLLRSRVWSRP
jgi:hypothetical protein